MKDINLNVAKSTTSVSKNISFDILSRISLGVTIEADNYAATTSVIRILINPSLMVNKIALLRGAIMVE
ncbi:hypothetical protein [Chryseobacterium nematophagum]|nr:hypothetical protein [Chryseobacterium nematophagum]